MKDRHALDQDARRLLRTELDPIYQDATLDELAAAARVSKSKAGKIRRSKLYQRTLEVYRREQLGILIEAKQRAQKKLVSLLRHKSASVAISAAERILKASAVPSEILDISPEVDNLAAAIDAIQSPEDWPAILRQVAGLALRGTISQDLAKTISYIYQNWQTAQKAAKDHKAGVEGQRDEVWAVTTQDGEPVRSRLEEIAKYPELLAEPGTETPQ